MQTKKIQINNRFFLNIFLLATVTFLFSSCKKKVYKPLQKSWELVWSDEFTGAVNWSETIQNGILILAMVMVAGVMANTNFIPTEQTM